MKQSFLLIACMLLSVWTYSQTYKLIAHRGGVVDSVHAENSLPALEAAIQQGHWMAELDLRLTKDGVFILHHDRTSNQFGVDKPASSLTWTEISKLKHNRTGSRIITLEEALRVCQDKMQVMNDNKIAGNDTVLFSQLIRVLEKYNLLEHALMIGTDVAGYFSTLIKRPS